jgi:hypothetical protein
METKTAHLYPGSSPLGNLAGDFDAYRVDERYAVWVRSCGLYSGGETDGRWFEVGDVSDTDVMAAIHEEIGLRPSHRMYAEPYRD